MAADIVLPQGFLASGLHCGVKSNKSANDLVLLVSESPCAAAGVFTQNRVVGAPVTVSRSRLPSTTVRGVVINSGNSNACTGERGIADAKTMTALVASEIGCNAEDILVCSTGVIGHFLPMEKLTAGIPAAAAKLAGTTEAFWDAARGMMTTDTVPKAYSETIELSGGKVTVAGLAKGAAMIAPNMATMLSVIMTDAHLDAPEATESLRYSADRSFNCISVEGHTSTSDTVLLLANGKSDVACQTDSDRQLLRAAIFRTCRDLAQKIIRDAEGAEHFVTVNVKGLPTRAEAARIAKIVCESPLVKTAITGNDPNWGRIVSAAGYSGVMFNEQDCSLKVNDHSLYESGTPVEFDEATVSAAMKTGEVVIDLQFTLGEESATYWTCDLTAEYIRLNADYTT
ncbi:MAG: bifunctional glutamate N-acetyltransferase/amino-acid acetyltransferase ArgJ [Planctomycetaceae bacterium]|nr:bifunctional glutamate N-acetyltransferase/amino-acid acetyltransferase ArgJ [Planctomycetaceae bacterium]